MNKKGKDNTKMIMLDTNAIPTEEQIQLLIDNRKENDLDVKNVSDGYHTFDELYRHRAILTAALFRQIPFTWKAKIHEDGTMFDGMFIVGVITPDGCATYHYHLPYWDMFKVPEIPHAPSFDGHTPEDAITRIEKFFARGTLVYSEEDLEKIQAQLEGFQSFMTEEEYHLYISTFMG